MFQEIQWLTHRFIEGHGLLGDPHVAGKGASVLD